MGGRAAGGDLAKPGEIRVRECRACLRDRGVAAIERQLGRLGIECVVAVDLVDGVIEHQPQGLLLAALEHAADGGGLVGMFGPQPDRLARCEAQVVEIDRVRNRDAHAHAIAGRRCFVDDPQVRERDAERDSFDQRAPAALDRDLRARGQPLGTPGGGQRIQPFGRGLHAAKA